MEIRKRGRYWAVLDEEGKLICLAVYKKGGMEVIRRLTERGGKVNEYKTERYR